jgi:hypothetical protein
LFPSGGPITAGLGGGNSLLGLIPDSGVGAVLFCTAQPSNKVMLSRMHKKTDAQGRKIVSLVFILFT